MLTNYNMNNEYKTEQELTDQYGDAIIDAISNHIYTRCYQKEEQIKGADYLFPRRIDIKFDYYDNENIVIEDSNAQWKDHPESWLWHGDDSDIVCYVKMAKSAAIIFSKKELREFTETERYKRRVEIRARNSQTIFKNFRLNEIDDSRRHVIVLSNVKFNIVPKVSNDAFIYKDN